MDDASFRHLLDAFSLSWEGYRKVRKGVKKRISRHMHELSCPTMAKYLDVMGTHPEARQQCELMLTVSISRFFRDTHLWSAIEKEILPDVFNKNVGTVNAWSACCANGEEVYSLKIVWDLAVKKSNLTQRLEILATDLNPNCLKRARAGSYPKSSLKELPDKYIRQHFNCKKKGKQFAVRSSLKENIKWETHHMLEDLPESFFHIIFFRNNVLTYYQDYLKEQIFRKVYTRLLPAGYFIIGSHEKLPYIPEDLISIGTFSYVFKKLE